MNSPQGQQTIMFHGSLFALLAYGSWGVFPLFWRELTHLNPGEIIAQRIVWACVFFFLLTYWKEQLAITWRLLRTWSELKMALVTAVLISINWFLFIYGVHAERVVEVSLGYFITPLMNVLMGALLLKEVIPTIRWISIGVAALGVLILTLQSGGLPWIALSLALSFSSYGYFRKKNPLPVLPVSTVETAALFFPCLFALFWFRSQGSLLEGTDFFLLPLSGIITALPLLWFAEAARRLPLNILALFQFLAPSLHFLIGVFIFREGFDWHQAKAFGLIWGALILSSSAPFFRRKAVSPSL